MHITGYLGDEPRDRVLTFMDAAVMLRYFEDVIPIRRPDGTIIAVAMYSRTLGPVPGDEVITSMCRGLAGILGRDTGLATAWDPAQRPRQPGPSMISGRGTGTVQGQVVTDHGELPAAAAEPGHPVLPGTVTAATGSPWCPCGHGEDDLCLNGLIYGPCGSEYCGGGCDDIGRCQGLPGCCAELRR